jgi:hypothetical protein
MNIDDIIAALRAKQVRITGHADQEALADGLSFDAIYASVLRGEIIADYPDDRPYPSCLIYGQNFAGEPIHSVWAYNSATGWAVIVTVYRPDPVRWIDWRTRRKDQ